MKNLDYDLPKAIKAHRAGRIAEAAARYGAVLRVQPNQPDANHNLGLIRVAEDDLETATKLFKKAVTRDPKNEQFWLSYINSLIQAQKFEKSRIALRKARKHGISSAIESKINQSPQLEKHVVSHHGRPTEAEINSLVFQYQNSDPSSSSRHALTFTKKYPEIALGWKVLAAIFYGCGQLQDALSAIKLATKITPSDAETINSAGVILRGLGRHQEAVKHYKKAISLNPDLWEAHLNLGNAHKDSGDLIQAETSYQKTLTLESDNGEAIYQLGSISQERGQLAEAEALYKRALLIQPDKAEVLVQLGGTLHELGKFNEAVAIFERATALSPRDGTATAGLGMAKYALGERAAGLRSIHRACQFAPDEPQFEALFEVLSQNESSTSAHLPAANNAHSEPKRPQYTVRPVEIGLSTAIYELPYRRLDNSPDGRFGDGRCSQNYKFFDESHSLIRSAKKDLMGIMRQAVGGDVLVVDSFFNIYSAHCGIHPHTHLNRMDSMRGIDLGSRKFSLVYYVDTGDQDCDHPGLLKFHEPYEEILPKKGMVAIFPASRLHSATYGGSKDRIMIGANFYKV